MYRSDGRAEEPRRKGRAPRGHCRQEASWSPVPGREGGREMPPALGRQLTGRESPGSSLSRPPICRAGLWAQGRCPCVAGNKAGPGEAGLSVTR